MTNPERLGLLVMTLALIGSFGQPLQAGELSLPPVETALPPSHTPAKAAHNVPRASKPAESASPERAAINRHRVHRVPAIAFSAPLAQPVPPRPALQPQLIEVASSTPQPSLVCRLWCSGLLVIGVTY